MAWSKLEVRVRRLTDRRMNMASAPDGSRASLPARFGGTATGPGRGTEPEPATAPGLNSLPWTGVARFGGRGTVHFRQRPTDRGSVRVDVDVAGLVPHAAYPLRVQDGGGALLDPFHSEDLLAKGNPAGTTRMAHPRPLGDLGSLTADAAGHCLLSFVDHRLAALGPASLLGLHAAIGHQDPALQAPIEDQAGPLAIRI